MLFSLIILKSMYLRVNSEIPSAACQMTPSGLNELKVGTSLFPFFPPTLYLFIYYCYLFTICSFNYRNVIVFIKMKILVHSVYR